MSRHSSTNRDMCFEDNSKDFGPVAEKRRPNVEKRTKTPSGHDRPVTVGENQGSGAPTSHDQLASAFENLGALCSSVKPSVLEEHRRYVLLDRDVNDCDLDDHPEKGSAGWPKPLNSTQGQRNGNSAKLSVDSKHTFEGEFPDIYPVGGSSDHCQKSKDIKERVYDDDSFGTPKSSRRSSTPKSSARRKKIEEDYDPENDIFMHDGMRMQYNFGKLKEEISKLLGTSDLSSGNVLQDSPDKTETCEGKSKDSPDGVLFTPPSGNLRKRTPKVSQKKVKRRSQLRGLCTSPVVPSKCETSAHSVQALLSARETLRKIAERTQNFSTWTESPPNSCATETSGNESKNNADDDLPPTQPYCETILRDVVAYVDVIFGDEDRSLGVKTQLSKLGAKVVTSFNKDSHVTHVIFHEGRISTYKKAVKRNIPLVSLMWIEECKKTGVKVSERLFPAENIEEYESPGAFIEKLKKRKKIINYEKLLTSPKPKKVKERIILESPKPKLEDATPQRISRVPDWVKEIVGEDQNLHFLLQLSGIKKKSDFKDLVINPSETGDETEVITPLAIRLLRKIFASRRNLAHEITEVGKSETASADDVGCQSSEFTVSSKQNNLGEGESCTASSSVCGKIASITNSDTCDSDSKRKVKKRKLLPLDYEHPSVDISDCENSSPPSKRFCAPATKPGVSSPGSGEIVEGSRGPDDPVKDSRKSDFLCPKSREAATACVPVQSSNGNTSAPLKRLSGSVTKLEENGQGSAEELESEVEIEGREVPGESVRKARRSSVDFIRLKSRSCRSLDNLPGIVCTAICSRDIDMIVSVIAKLGGFDLELSVTARTTHVVSGSKGRTMKILKGMARGCWIVSSEWVLRSLEEGRWIDEEEYEMKTAYPAILKYRLDKMSFGALFQPDIFGSCGSIFVSSRCEAPRSEVLELLHLCGGRVVSDVGSAKVVVGRSMPGVICVNPTWVFDSVSEYECKPYKNYVLKETKK